MSAIVFNPEQLQMVKIIHDNAILFPLNETGNTQLLQTCYDHMDAFKQVMDSTSHIHLSLSVRLSTGFYILSQLAIFFEGRLDDALDL